MPPPTGPVVDPAKNIREYIEFFLPACGGPAFAAEDGSDAPSVRLIRHNFPPHGFHDLF
jgi:hypothetical protein